MSAKSCSSSPGTTPLRPDGGSAGWAWCFTPRNTLFFRRRASRLWSKIGFRPVGRGASLPAILVLSSPGTTSLGQNGASAGWAWCFAPRNALFFRRRAPRLWDKMGLRPVGRGASLLPMPCSFVAGHHVFGAKSDFSRLGVVLRFPQCLVLSSTGTTSLGQNGASAGWAWCFAPRNTLFFRRRAPRQHAYSNEKPASKNNLRSSLR